MVTNSYVTEFLKQNHVLSKIPGKDITELKGMNFFQTFDNILPENLNQCLFPIAVKVPITYQPSTQNKYYHWQVKKKN